MNRFSRWAAIIAWIWLGGFILISGGFISAFYLPFSPVYNSRDPAAVLKIFQELLNNYLPFLGIILGAYFASRRNANQQHGPGQNQGYGKIMGMILVLSLFFNLMVLFVLLGHLWDRENTMDTFKDFLGVLNTGFSFLIAYFLTQFFERELHVPEQNEEAQNNQPPQE